MEIVKKHFPHCIRRMLDVEYEHFTPTGKGNRFIVDVHSTLYSSRLLKQICKHIGIPHDDGLFDIMLLCNKDAEMDIGVVYNCNYTTRADAANAVKVANFFADGQPGKWYLDHTEWQ